MGGLAALASRDDEGRLQLLDSRLDGIDRRNVQPLEPAASPHGLEDFREPRLLCRQIEMLDGIANHGFDRQREARSAAATARFDRHQRRHAAAGEAPCAHQSVDGAGTEPQLLCGVLGRALRDDRRVGEWSDDQGATPRLLPLRIAEREGAVLRQQFTGRNHRGESSCVQR